MTEQPPAQGPPAAVPPPPYRGATEAAHAVRARTGSAAFSAASAGSSPIQGPGLRSTAVARAALLWSAVALLLVTAVFAGGAALARDVYSAAGFAERYVDALARGDAAAALEIPGVRPQGDDASVGLLRSGVLSSISEVRRVSSVAGEDGIERVTLAAAVDGEDTEMVFAVERDGTRFPFLPTWRFAVSPTATLQLNVRHTQDFTLNGFELDVRQLRADGTATFETEAPSFVFVPGRYVAEHESPYLRAAAVGVLASEPGARIPLVLDARPTDAFTDQVRDTVNTKLEECAAQKALFPSDCPFGFEVDDRIASEPSWSVTSFPPVSLEATPGGWRLAPSTAVLHIDVDVRSLFDGSVTTRSEDVHTRIEGTVTLSDDGMHVLLGG